jgi:type IV pilus assembly protein PilM
MGVGLDIGSRTIKVVELAKEGKGWRLLASGIVGFEGLSPDAVKEAKDIDLIGQVIKKLFREAKISSKEVSVALPEPSVFTRTIKFPPLTDQEVASAVKWEAEQYIPIPVADAIVQHQILERKETNPPQVLVLLVASPRAITEKYVKVLQDAGLTVVGVETELLALTRALAPAGKTALLVDFGAKTTDIAITHNGQLTFSRSISTGGEAFTRAVAQGLGMQYAQAEEYKRAYGLSGNQLEGKVKQTLDPVFKIVTDEIKKATHFYQSDGGDAPALVILSGGTSNMPEAMNTVSRLLGLETVLGNPFANVVVEPEAMKALAPYAPLYSIAVGLAMRET